MTDFFDDLERQLVAATPQRLARIRRARQRRAAATLSVLVALLAGGAGIAAAVGGSTGESGSGPSGAPAGTATTAATTPRPSPAGPSASSALPGRDVYTVAILNGTTVPGLGRGVANRLQNDGFKIGNVTNAAAQDHATTTVYYRTPDCVPAATQVASVLRLGDAQGDFALQKAPKGLRVLAGDAAKVIVVVGSDQNDTAGP